MVNCSAFKKYKLYFILLNGTMLVIPEYYFYNKELTSNEKIVLALIYSFNRTELLTTKFIAKELWISAPTVLKAIKELNTRWLIAWYNDEIHKVEDVERQFNC